MSAVAENTDGNTDPRARSLANLKPWKPGQSGNPGGRPKDSAKAAREEIGGTPEVLMKALLRIIQDESAQNKDIISAVREYWSRGWGLPASFTSIEGQDPLGLSDLDSEIQAIADELSKRRAA